ncbi:DNA primase [Beggiatoa leptomitoformis]|uniref:DNA primase n=1 Tax=Beggiatoa leptomitoformis TaxID=288004 RepID=A0A2N9YI52_9GAMM|nr:DNA primase [Beggiatoa leptomitoformis]ALG67614.1 DNA primase [Beggiatoa leptomitoformis]AUI70154.1 DNA primase [Beggiatoa leptomitoformis]
MRIARSFINDLVARADIVEIIDSYVPLRKAGRNYVACCPFHNEKTPSFSVSAEKQFYHCFGCGVHGTVLTFLVEHGRMDFYEAVHELSSRLGINVIYEEGSDNKSTFIETHSDLYAVMVAAARYYQQQLHQPVGREALAYLQRRGLSDTVIAEFEIGYAPAEWDGLLKALKVDSATLLQAGLLTEHESGKQYDRFRHRVMFPIHDQRGQVIAFGGRVLDDSKPKYLNSPETPLFSKGKELYHWDKVRKARALKRVVVVEGYMDVVALTQHHVTNGVATLGTATTPDHLQRLFRSVSDIVFCFDGDEAGRKAAWRTVETVLPLLQDGRQISFAFLPEEDDPDSFVRRQGTDAFNTYLDEALPLSQFLLNTLTQQVKLDSIEGQARLTELIRPYINQLPDGTYRELLLKNLKKLVPVDLKKSTTLKDIGKKTENAFNRTPKKANFKELSLVEQLIVYLLLYPQFAQEIEYPNKKLSGLYLENIDLLIHILVLVRNNPTLTLAGICEQWRDTDYAELVNRFAIYQPHFLEEQRCFDVKQEFNDVIQRLYAEYERQRWQFLLQKFQKGTITEEEKQEFKTVNPKGVR